MIRKMTLTIEFKEERVKVMGYSKDLQDVPLIVDSIQRLFDNLDINEWSITIYDV